MHISVLQKEVIEYLDIQPNENFIDATLGLSGHTLSILEKNKPRGCVLGIEINHHLYKELLKKNIDRLILINDSFVNLKRIVQESNLNNIKGILFDLGLSSWHLEMSQKGFSFLRNETLDMRYGNSESSLTAKDIINKYSEKELVAILKKYGQERFAKKIASNIVKARQKKIISTTFDLVEIIKQAVPSWYLYRKRHFATKSFQAIRIAVNDELENLKKALPQAFDALQKQGKLVVISFHSLEDKIIKNYFKQLAEKKLVKILTKKPIGPKKAEIINNPRSRSAKLRAAVKI